PATTDPERQDEAAQERMLAQTPLGRIATSDEIADGVIYLCSDEARYITGIDLQIAGGRDMAF
ncbi:MAG: SDR family oxidoreductase, partial [Nitrospinaceae bacterium]|nr:SDR family oxidoreductase [Nitrospinaceae bacterium]